MGKPTGNGWHTIWVGCMYYLSYVDLEVGPPVFDAASNTRNLVVDFALKCVAHSMVAHHSWETPVVDVITPNGIAPFCADEWCTPSFVYEMFMAFEHIIRPFVKSDDSTWGKIKALYK